MTFRERLEWIFRMALMLFILASVAFLSALLAIRFTIQGREVAVPDVVGKKAVEAQQMLQGRGITSKSKTISTIRFPSTKSCARARPLARK